VARHYTERLSVHGMAIELAIRQWARTDSAAAAACASVDEARLKLAGQLYRDLGFSPAESRERAILLYSFLFGQSLLFVEYGPRGFASITDAGTGLLMGLPSENRKRKGTPRLSTGRGSAATDVRRISKVCNSPNQIAAETKSMEELSPNQSIRVPQAGRSLTRPNADDPTDSTSEKCFGEKYDLEANTKSSFRHRSRIGRGQKSLGKVPRHQ
jgi:hypothetical protein